MGLDEYTTIIEELERMANIHERVESGDARRSYAQYVDLIVEQTDFSFAEKSDLRHYWRGLIKKKGQEDE